MAKTTSFKSTVALGSGPYFAYYAWSNPANWTNGVPANGDTVLAIENNFNKLLDDIPNLSLASLTIGGQNNVFTQTVEVPGVLTVQNLAGTSTTPNLIAKGAAARIFLTGPVSASYVLSAFDGAKIVTSAPTTRFEETNGTIAFTAPAAINGGWLNSVTNAGDILELPGTRVDKLTYSDGVFNRELSITTDAGTYDFHASSGPSEFNYKTALDPETGLLAITFLPKTDVKPTTPAPPESPYKGENRYLWSEPTNWTHEMPANNIPVIINIVVNIVFNIDFRFYSYLRLGAAFSHLYVAGNLTIDLIELVPGAIIDTDVFAGGFVAPHLTIGHLSGSGATIGATGPGAITTLLGSFDPGENYKVSYGGELWIDFSLSVNSTLTFAETGGIIALKHPGAMTSAVFNGVGPGDVLELPGSTVSNLALSGSTLTVTTDVSTYTFDHFNWSNISYFNWTLDVSSNLVAIRFLGRPPGHDFNGDFNSDLLFHNQATGQLLVWEMGGGQVIGGGLIASMNPSQWAIRAEGDFGGDFSTDVLWQDKTSGNLFVWQLSGSSVLSSAYLATMGANFSIVAQGDFNGDLRTDLIWRDASTGNLFEWQMNGASVSGGGYVGTMPGNWSIKSHADFNGDGRDDLLWFDQNTGNLFLWEMNGTGVSGGGYVGTMPAAAWTLLASGDFNGDGRADLLWQDKSNGNLFLWDMNGTSAVSGGYVGTQSVSAWQLASFGDFSGDARTDLLWSDGSGNLFEWQMVDRFVVSGAYVGTLDSSWVVANH